MPTILPEIAFPSEATNMPTTRGHPDLLCHQDLQSRGNSKSHIPIHFYWVTQPHSSKLKCNYLIYNDNYISKGNFGDKDTKELDCMGVH